MTPVTYSAGLVERVYALAPHGVDLALDTAGRGATRTWSSWPAPRTTSSPSLTSPPAVRRAGDRRPAGERVARPRSGGAAYEENRFARPVAQSLPLEQAAEAHRLSQNGHVRGKLVLTVD